MKAVIFVKKSERLPGKHSLYICGKSMIQIVCDSLFNQEIFDEVIVLSKDPSIKCDKCTIIKDESNGVLIDSIIEAIRLYGEILAVGGDMPYIDVNLINKIMKFYSKTPISMKNEKGIIEPLFSIYNKSIMKDMENFARETKSIFKFIEKNFRIIEAGEDSWKLDSINTIDDLIRARIIFGCQ